MHADPTRTAPVKTTSQRIYRRKTPTQRALFLQHITATANAVDNPNHSNDVQTEFDIFYSKMINLLNIFTPLEQLLLAAGTQIS